MSTPQPHGNGANNRPRCGAVRSFFVRQNRYYTFDLFTGYRHEWTRDSFSELMSGIMHISYSHDDALIHLPIDGRCQDCGYSEQYFAALRSMQMGSRPHG